MSRLNNFSIVMATYTGQETITAVFDSLLDQDDPGVTYEVIVVVDGPSPELMNKVQRAATRFQAEGIVFRIKQNHKNLGRFEARWTGAKLAKYDYLLIMDDRVELPPRALKTMVASGQLAIMPDVAEKSAANFVSLTLSCLRRRLYGAAWNSDFEPYYISAANFDKSPKGTAAFWIKRQYFLDACVAMSKAGRRRKSLSDDTKLLRHIVDSGVEIYKTSDIRVSYSPRASARAELAHIYRRGPMFVDYYLAKGSRYFWPLLVFYIFLAAYIVLLVLWLPVLIVAAVLLVLAGLLISKNITAWPKITAGLAAVGFFFGAGLVTGLLNKTRHIL